MKISALSRATKRAIVITPFAIVAVGARWLWMQCAGNNDGLLRLHGNVDIREVNLAFQQPGRVAEMRFDEGDVVTADTHVAN